MANRRRKSKRRSTSEIDRLRSGDLTEAELNRVKKQARALFAYSTERVTMQAFWLAFTENVESYDWFENYVANLEAVTLDDVKEAAAHYLRPQNRTVGYFIPTDGGRLTTTWRTTNEFAPRLAQHHPRDARQRRRSCWSTRSSTRSRW